MRCLNCHQQEIPLSTEICPNCAVNLPSLMRDVLPHGTLLQNGTYLIDYALGRGGFGITYQAIHTALEKQVAIKEFYPQEHALREGTTGELMVPTSKQEIYQRGLERFLREGKTLAQIDHPNVVRVENFFEERGTAYLVMELITGRTLREELEVKPDKCLSSARVETIMSALVGALEAVHQQGIYHLDLKPDNVLTSLEERLVLVDFGASRQGLSSGTTQAFTLNYAPPEVIAGRDMGAASDLFELGMMLHEMLMGKLPPIALDRIGQDTWEPKDLAEPWRSLVTAALRLPPSERPQSVQQWWQSQSVPPPPAPAPLVPISNSDPIAKIQQEVKTLEKILIDAKVDTNLNYAKNRFESWRNYTSKLIKDSVGANEALRLSMICAPDSVKRKQPRLISEIMQCRNYLIALLEKIEEKPKSIQLQNQGKRNANQEL